MACLVHVDGTVGIFIASHFGKGMDLAGQVIHSIALGRDTFHGLRIADIPDHTLNPFRTDRRPARIMSQCPYDIPVLAEACHQMPSDEPRGSSNQNSHEIQRARKNKPG